MSTSNKERPARRSRLTNCPDDGPRIEGFALPCILMVLRERPMHGYDLIEELNKLGFLKPAPDPGIVYRHLRNLEADGMVVSHVEPGAGGPARKVYVLREDGHRCLEEWIASLKNRRDCIEGLLFWEGSQRRTHQT